MNDTTKKIENFPAPLQFKLANITIHAIIEGQRLLKNGEAERSQELLHTLSTLKSSILKGEFETNEKAQKIWELLIKLNPSLSNLNPEKNI
jgi:hypothetical protein